MCQQFDINIQYDTGGFAGGVVRAADEAKTGRFKRNHVLQTAVFRRHGPVKVVQLIPDSTNNHRQKGRCKMLSLGFAGSLVKTADEAETGRFNKNNSMYGKRRLPTRPVKQFDYSLAQPIITERRVGAK